MHEPTWQSSAPDYHPPNPRGTRPSQQQRYPTGGDQRQNGTTYNGSTYPYGSSQLSDAVGQLPNGFSHQQPQYPGHSFPTQGGLPMNVTSPANFNGGYPLGPSHPPSVGFNAHQFTQDLQGYYPNPTFSPPSQASLSPSYTNTSPQPTLPSDLTPSIQRQAGPSYLSPPTTSTDISAPHKRQRNVEHDPDDSRDGEADMERTTTKSQGACVRCKGLKVKCEFRTDTDPCRRCLNAGADCQIPGRKKRRTPPKREHLLNQIRDQAAQIEHLMAQLEKSHQNLTPSTSPLAHSNSIDLSNHSPGISPSTPASSYFNQSPAALAPETNFNHNHGIEEWISKARESLAHFDGIINGVKPQSLVDDQEDSGDDGFFTGEEDLTAGDYDITVEYSNGEEETTGQKNQGPIARKPSNGSKAAPKHSALPTAQSPFGLVASMAKINVRDESELGVTGANYFERRSESPQPEGMAARSLNAAQIAVPQILKRGIINTALAEQLFGIYFDYMNLSLSLLDPRLYTPHDTFVRSPFLFTTICAIASRYHENKELYPQAIHYAQVAAAEALIGGVKNVEMASAYILLSLYPVPARRWEDDRSWLYLGLAIRVATDLNLQKPPAKPVNEAHAREMLNRTRVWLNCFNLDRSTGSQHGKPPIIRDTDYMACHSEDWWQGPYNIPNFDIHICGYNAELRLMGRFVGKIHSNPEHPKGFNKDADWERLAAETDDEVARLGDKWFAITSLSEDPQSKFRTALLKLAYSYARLAVLSYAFQQGVTKNKFTEENFPILMRCLRAATDVVSSYLQNVAKPNHLIYLRHGPEAQSVFVTFASAFLVKLLHPKFVKHVSVEQRKEIRTLVEKVVAVLGSPEVAIDERHAPKLYSRFLQGLLDTPMAKADISSPTSFQAALPRTRFRKSKEGSKFPGAERDDYLTGPLPSNVNTSSPPPNFGMTNGAPSFPHMSMLSAQPSTTHSSPEIPHIAFDNDLLSSMQQFTEPNLWADYSTLPGLSWMSQLQDSQMTDSLIFDSTSLSTSPFPSTNQFQ